MIDQTRFFVTERDKIDTNIESGVINANDLVICSDTHELIYVNPDNTYFAITTTGDGMNELVQNLEDKLAEIREMAENSVVTGVKGSNELTYRKGNVNLGTDDFGLGNVTNHAQVRGLITGTTENHVLTWGPNGYIVKDSGYTIQSDVPENAVFTDTTYDVATTETDGLMSAIDKAKLDGLNNNNSSSNNEIFVINAIRKNMGMFGGFDKTGEEILQAINNGSKIICKDGIMTYGSYTYNLDNDLLSTLTFYRFNIGDSNNSLTVLSANYSDNSYYAKSFGLEE